MQLFSTTTIQDIFDAERISVRANNCCIAAGIITMADLDRIRRASGFMSLKNCGRKTSKELESLCQEYGSQMSLNGISKGANELTENGGTTHPGSGQLSLEKDAFLSSEFFRLRQGLSVRAQNICNSTYSSYKDILPFLDYGEKSYRRLFITKRKSAGELFSFLTAFKKVYEKVVEYSDAEIARIETESKYPFLLTPEIEFVQSVQSNIGRIPMVYVAEKYFSIASDKLTSFFAQYYGIPGGNPKTLDSLALINHSTRERVRQQLVHYVPPKEIVSDQDERWAYYRKTMPVFLCESSEYYDKIREEEHLSGDFLSFAGIMTAALNYSTLHFHKKLFLVAGDLKEEARDGIKSVFSLFETKYANDKTFNVRDEFSLKTTREIQLYTSIIKCMYGVSVSYNNEIIIKQGRVSVEEEVVNVLVCFGEPMSIEDLFLFFKDKYPEHKYTEAKSLRPYIAKSDRIVAIGKSGKYGLKEWNLFTGSIRDCAYELLKNSDMPISDDDLTEAILERFPDSNSRSIISSLMSDGKSRFVHFQNYFTGLAGKVYPKSFKLSASIIPFEERLELLRAFIVKYQRYPFMRGGDEEESLYRWIRNHTKPGAMYNKDDADSILTLLNEYSSLPHTEREYKFLNMCSDYKHFITEHYSLPELESENEYEQELAGWFIKAHTRTKSYDDNRVDYFKDLLQFMNDYGFYIE